MFECPLHAALLSWQCGGHWPNVFLLLWSGLSTWLQRVQLRLFRYCFHNPLPCFILRIIAGYGQSTGRPSEKNLYADIAAALKALESRYQIRPEQVVLYGQSIGTVPSGK